MRDLMKAVMLLLALLGLVSENAYADSWRTVPGFTTQAPLKLNTPKCRYRLKYAYFSSFLQQPIYYYFYSSDSSTALISKITTLSFPLQPFLLVGPERLQSVFSDQDKASLLSLYNNSSKPPISQYFQVSDVNFPHLSLTVESYFTNQLLPQGFPVNNAFFSLEQSC